MLSNSVAELTGSVAEFECCFLSVGSAKIGGRMAQSVAEFASRKYNRNVF